MLAPISLSRWRSNRANGALARIQSCLTLLALTLCVSTAVAQTQTSAPIASALQEVLEGKRDLQQLRIDADWQGRSVTVYGSGVGIWNQHSEFRLGPEKLRLLVAILRQHRYGEVGAIGERAPQVEVPMVYGGVRVAVGKTTRTDSLNNRGLRMGQEDIRLLAERLLNVCEVFAQNAKKAGDLRDGLRKIIAGTLAPESFELVVQRHVSSDLNKSSTFAISGGKRIVRSHNTEEAESTLSPSELKSVAKILLQNDVDSLPVNLYAPAYTDLYVRVLNFDHSVQARSFANTTATTYGEKQKTFEEIIAQIDATTKNTRTTQ